MSDPIVAIASAPHRAAIGIIRVSASDVSPFLNALDNPPPRTAVVRSIYDQHGALLDSGVVIYFEAPHSFTGEYVIEFQGHGAPVLLDAIVAEFCRLGARPARPGEFTERAFLNGKFDLAQAEAIADIIDASTLASAQAAQRSHSGEFSNKIDTLALELREVRALVEGAIDFADEDIEFIDHATLKTRLDSITAQLKALLKGAKRGQYLRRGVVVALVGPPNAGKSTLLNAMLDEERAITSDIAGTTRGVVEAQFELNGISITLADTAGIRESSDPIETIGIEKSYAAAHGADLVIVLLPADADELPHDFEFNVPTIYVTSKSDLLDANDAAASSIDPITISAKTGDGLEVLSEEILKTLDLNESDNARFTTRARHVDAIRRSQHHIDTALEQSAMDAGVELVAEEIRLAHDALGEITGKVIADDILGDIFSKFCIGK